MKRAAIINESVILVIGYSFDRTMCLVQWLETDEFGWVSSLDIEFM